MEGNTLAPHSAPCDGPHAAQLWIVGLFHQLSGRFGSECDAYALGGRQTGSYPETDFEKVGRIDSRAVARASRARFVGTLSLGANRSSLVFALSFLAVA
jgi:hypothetical protein